MSAQGLLCGARDAQAFSCPICLESDLEGEPVCCPGCSEGICNSCFEEYCLSKELDICCFNTACKFPWSEEFVDQNSYDTFRNGRLRAHRAKILVDQEKARLPALQDRARIMKAALKVKRKQTPGYIRQVLESYGLPLDGYTLSHLEPDEVADIINIFGDEVLHSRRAGSRSATMPKKAAIQARACYQRSCRGFLNSENVCGVCDTHFCRSCHEDLSKPEPADSAATAKHTPEQNDGACVKVAAATAKHTCDPAVVATIKLIAQETKPCPTCATAIFKIDGCDQMWCTQCQTPFSWHTGQKETGGIHNPHYYEWLRRTRGAVPRQEELRCEQGHLMEFYIPHIHRDKCYSDTINTTFTWNYYNNALQIFHQQLREHRQYHLGPVDNESNEEELTKLGIAYLSGKISPSEWERRVYLKKREVKRIQTQKDIIRVHVAAGTDILNALLTGRGDVKAGATLKQVDELINFTQEALDTCAGRFFYTGKIMRSVELPSHIDLPKLLGSLVVSQPPPPPPASSLFTQVTDAVRSALSCS